MSGSQGGAGPPGAGPSTAVQPTPRLAFWLAVAALGLAVDPLAPGALWATLAANVVLLVLLWDDRRRLRDTAALVLERRREPVFSLGAANPVTLALTNRSGTAFHVEVIDEPPAAFRVDREEFRVALDGHTAWEAGYRLTPTRRGDYRFGGLNLRARTRLGLLALHRRELPTEERVRVYPNLRDARALSLLGMGEPWMRLGVRTVRSLEAGREFESLRDYRPGDEYRSLDWKATARRGKLTVRQYDVERSQKILLVLDLGRTMTSRLGDLSKADLAINACVLLTSVAARMDDRVGVVAFADRVLGFLPPGRGRGQAARLLEFLYPLEAVAAESDYRAAFHEIAMRLHGRTLVIVFTDLVDPDSSSQLIAQLGVLALRHSVLCVALADYELDALLEERPRAVADLYRQAVAESLLEDRDLAAAALAGRGVGVTQATAVSLSVEVVNRYLQWKSSGRVGRVTA